MLPFLQQPVPPKLPNGYRLETTSAPSPESLNKLLASCQETTHSEDDWQRALDNSLWQLSVLEESSGELVGFVRATSDLHPRQPLESLFKARAQSEQPQRARAQITEHAAQGSAGLQPVGVRTQNGGRST